MTELLGDLLDQAASDIGPPPRWVLPPIHLGPRRFDTTLLPRFQRTGDEVRIVAVATADSDVDAELSLDLLVAPLGGGASRLTTTWQLRLDIPVPRAAMLIVGPAIDRTVESTIASIAMRTEAAVVEAASS